MANISTREGHGSDRAVDCEGGRNAFCAMTVDWKLVSFLHLLQERIKHPFTAQMEQEVTDFFFNHYRVHLNSRPALSEAYACIPQVTSNPLLLRAPPRSLSLHVHVVVLRGTCLHQLMGWYMWL